MLKRKQTEPAGPDGAAEHPVSVVGQVGSATRYFNTAALLVVILMALAAVAILLVQGQQQKRALVQQMEAVTEIVTQRIANEMALRRELLIPIASDTSLVELLRAENDLALNQLSERLHGRVPGLLRLRFLPKGWDQLDPESSPPISYATLDMLRDVERSGRPSPAEVHQAGGADQHIALALPVRDGSEIVGTVHAAFPFSILQQALNAAGGLPGALMLQQVVKQSPVTLITTDGVVSQMEADGGRPIENTIWRTAYRMPAIGMFDGAQLVTLAVLALGGVIMVLMLGFQARHFKRAVRDDLESMFTLVELLKSGSVGRVKTPKLEEFGHVFGLIRQVWHEATKSQAVVRQTTASRADEKPLPQMDLPDISNASSSIDVVESAVELPASIFRAYDIRGVVGDTLTEEIVFEIGRAIGSEAQAQGEQTVVVARDGRHSGEALINALSEGLLASGRDVLDIGMVPTPVLYFATHYLGTKSGVMITGSHNPPEYNGLKIVINGSALSGERIADLKRRIEQGDLQQGRGSLQQQDLLPDYLQRILDDVQLSRPLKVVVDCGNGVAGVVAPALLQTLGCDIVPLFCEVDGDFPNHHPDPGKPENLRDLIEAVRENNADLGVAFDGDGDRLGVVDAKGKVIWPDRVLMLLARDVLSRQPGGDVIFDVKSSRLLADEILAYGGRPIMWKTGHSLIKAKMRETGALLAGEMSGHIFIGERWFGFDDGIYSCARLLELLSMESQSPSEVFDALPESVSTPELNISFDQEGENFELMQKLTASADFTDAKLTDIDGLRVEFEDGWGLVRPSNTTPSVVLRFEADDEAALERIQSQFRVWLQSVDETLQIPF